MASKPNQRRNRPSRTRRKLRRALPHWARVVGMSVALSLAGHEMELVAHQRPLRENRPIAVQHMSAEEIAEYRQSGPQQPVQHHGHSQPMERDPREREGRGEEIRRLRREEHDPNEGGRYTLKKGKPRSLQPSMKHPLSRNVAWSRGAPRPNRPRMRSH